MRSRMVSVLVVVGLALSACSSLRTTGSPTGDRTLTARFDDVQHLVVGHTVRIGDVPVGTVTSVDLDGHTPVVEISISDNHDIPAGTTAAISATSLLGENYVRLQLPDRDSDAVLQDGDELDTTGADASFEEMTVQVLGLLRAIQGEDIATVIDESHAALVGRGPELNDLIQTVETVSGDLVTQTDDLVAVIDSLSQFGSDLVDDADLLGESIDATATATGQLATQRDRIVDTVAQILDVAEAFDSEVLLPHRDRLDLLLDRLNPIADTLVAELGQLVSIVEAAVALGQKAPHVIDDDGVARGFIVVRSVSVPGGPQIEIPCLTCVLGLSGSTATPAHLTPADVVESMLFGSAELGGKP